MSERDKLGLNSWQLFFLFVFCVCVSDVFKIGFVDMLLIKVCVCMCVHYYKQWILCLSLYRIA